MCVSSFRGTYCLRLHGRSDINALSPFFLLYKRSFRTRRLTRTGNEFRIAHILIFRFFWYCRGKISFPLQFRSSRRFCPSLRFCVTFRLLIIFGRRFAFPPLDHILSIKGQSLSAAHVFKSNS